MKHFKYTASYLHLPTASEVNIL